jgi:uncharacterized membrane protein
MRWLFTILVGLLLAGIVHIVTLLALPRLIPQDAYARLGKLGPDNAFHIVAGPARNRPTVLPFLDPAYVYAVCRYDLAGGPLHIHAPVPASYAALSLYNQDGLPYFAINERSAVRGALDVMLQQQASDDDGSDDDDADADSDDARVTTVPTPSPRGFAMLRILVTSPDREAELREVLGTARCEPAPAD